jgi:hypothetical protein
MSVHDDINSQNHESQSQDSQKVSGAQANGSQESDSRAATAENTSNEQRETQRSSEAQTLHNPQDPTVQTSQSHDEQNVSGEQKQHDSQDAPDPQEPLSFHAIRSHWPPDPKDPFWQAAMKQMDEQQKQQQSGNSSQRQNRPIPPNGYEPNRHGGPKPQVSVKLRIGWILIGFFLDIFSFPLVFIYYMGRDPAYRMQALKYCAIGFGIEIILYALVMTLWPDAINTLMAQYYGDGGLFSSGSTGSSSSTSAF